MPLKSGQNPQSYFSEWFDRWFDRLARRWARPYLPPTDVPDRVLDGIPGFLAWVSIILVIIGTIFVPWTIFSLAAILAAYMALRFAVAGYANLVGLRRIRQWNTLDWRAEYTRRHTPESLAWEDVKHVIVIPNYKEDLDIMRATLDRIASSPIARQQIIIVLAMEASDPGANQTATTLQHEYGPKFLHVLVTNHPRGLPGEIPGKSANVGWGASHAKWELVDRMGYSLDHLVVTIGDADSMFHPRYFESLTCHFATMPNRYLTFFQSPIRYHSNVWTIHPALRLLHAYSSAWELAYSSGGWWQAFPISTFSLSMRLAAEVDFWDGDVIADDCHMFVKCYYRKEGKVSLTPIYLPFSCYAVAGNGFLDACRNRYVQTVRHAWGAKEIGFAFKQMGQHPVPFFTATRVFLRVLHDNLMAGAGWVIITFGTQLPLLFKPELVQNGLWSPQFILLQSSLVVVVLIGFLFYAVDARLRPHRVAPRTVAEVILTGLSFALLSFIVLFLVAIPAIEAQTRLLLGIPLHFQVARKK